LRDFGANIRRLLQSRAPIVARLEAGEARAEMRLRSARARLQDSDRKCDRKYGRKKHDDGEAPRQDDHVRFPLEGSSPILDLFLTRFG